MRLGRFKTRSRAAERASTDVDASAVERLHRDLEAVALVAHEIANRNAAIFKDYRGGRLAVPP